MALRLRVLAILALACVTPAVAEKYEPFDSPEGPASHGWSIYSPTTDFAASVVSTSRAAGTSGPGEAEIIVSPVPFKQSVYFADTDLGGKFTLEDDFSFSGKMKLEGLDPGDSMQIVIGFFDSDAVRHPSPFTKPPYVGIVIGGGYGNPYYFVDGPVGVGNGWFKGGAGGAFLLEFDSDDPMPISMDFTADRGWGTDGHVGAKIGSKSTGHVLVNYQNDHPTFDAFGVLVWGSIFDEVTGITIVLDDLRYSTATPEPSSLLLLVLAGGCVGLFRRRPTRKGAFCRTAYEPFL